MSKVVPGEVVQGEVVPGEVVDVESPAAAVVDAQFESDEPPADGKYPPSATCSSTSSSARAPLGISSWCRRQRAGRRSTSMS